MLIIPMWLRLSFHEKYRVNRHKTFYYAPTTGWWWYFQDYEIFRFHMGFSLENRKSMKEALEYLRTKHDAEGKWSNKVGSEYSYVKYGGSLLASGRDWPDLRRNTMLWNELPYIHYYGNEKYYDWTTKETRRALGHGKKGYLFRGYHWFLASYSRSKNKVLDIEGIYKQNARLYWRKILCTRVDDTNRFRYRRYQWAFWDFETSNPIRIIGHYPSSYSNEYDLSTYIPTEDDSEEILRLKRNTLFLVDSPEHP